MHTRRPRRTTAAVIAVASGLLLASCGGGSDDADDAASDSLLPAAEGTTEYPLTLDTWLGETTLEERPERIAVIGFSSNLDALEAIDVTPVYYGGRDAEADWAWNDPDYLDGIEVKDVPDDDGINFEGVAAARPDLIVSFNAVFEESDHDKLAAIAPVLDLTEDPGNGDRLDWRENQRQVGEALDLADAADAAVSEADERIAAVAAEHPEFEGKSLTMAYDYGPEFGVSYYTVSGGPTEGLMSDLGFATSPNAGDFIDDDVVSDENLGKLDADVLITIFADDTVREAREKQQLFQGLSAVQEGRYASLTFEPDPPYQLERADGEMVDNAVWVLRRGASAVALPWAAEEIADGWLGGLDLS